MHIAGGKKPPRFCPACWSHSPKAVKVRHNNIRLGAGMKILLGLGKALAALFWGAALANLLDPFAQPFAALLYLASALIVLVHGVELWLFDDRLGNARQPWLQRVQVVLFGVFHVLTLPPAQALEQEGSDVQLGGEQA